MKKKTEFVFHIADMMTVDVLHAHNICMLCMSDVPCTSSLCFSISSVKRHKNYNLSITSGMFVSSSIVVTICRLQNSCFHAEPVFLQASVKFLLGFAFGKMCL